MFGAGLQITGIRVGGRPGIELLEYLAPPTGRPMPVDSSAVDLWHWQTRLVTDGIYDVYYNRMRAHASFISPGVVELPGDGLGFRNGLNVRGPDCHVMQIVQQ